MLRPVLLLAGMMLAVAAAIPELFARLDRDPPPAEAARAAEEAAPVAASLDHGGIVRLRADSRGHYVTAVEVNGRPLDALVDTGATMVALRFEDARALGVVTPGDRFDVGVRTANGEGRARRVQLRSVRVGSITIRDVDALVLEAGMLGVNLLGMSFLNRLARFEVQRGELVLER